IGGRRRSVHTAFPQKLGDLSPAPAYHGAMALPEVETERFSARYRLTSRDARSILWCFVIERAPVFVGLALLVLLTANTSVFGAAGRMTPIVVPLLVAWRLLDVYNRTRRAIDPVKEITTT